MKLGVVIPAVSIGCIGREDRIEAFARIRDAEVGYQHQGRSLAVGLVNSEYGLPGPRHETIRAFGAGQISWYNPKHGLGGDCEESRREAYNMLYGLFTFG